MEKNTIIFDINTQEKITIFLPDSLIDIFKYDEVKIVYSKEESNDIILYDNNSILYGLDALRSSLQEILMQKLKLHSSIEKSIGYLWNEKIQNNVQNFTYEIYSDGTRYWVGTLFLLWDTRATTTWFYEKEGKFILEITPVYKWHSTDPTPEEKKEYVTYKQFIKNYKPYVVTEISQETIHEWLEQTKYLLALIESNDDKFIIKNEENEKQYQAFMEAQKKE